MEPGQYDTLIRTALEEDLSDTGDITTNAVFSGRKGRALLVCKSRGTLAGCGLFARVFKTIDTETDVLFYSGDGDSVSTGDLIAEIAGGIRNILTGERTAINFLSYLSGIATQTKEYVAAAQAGGNALILDTRKTLPGYRALAKYAVRCGGGKNHRMGLYDMVMIKDNHIDAACSITEAVRRVRGAYGATYRIEVECRTVEDVDEALELDVDMIMLDNMSIEQVKTAVEARRKRKKDGIPLEVSGNMDRDKTRIMSGTGVEYISVGNITHSVRAVDFSLQITEELGAPPI